MVFGLSDVSFQIDADASGARRSISNVQEEVSDIVAPAVAAGEAVDNMADQMGDAASDALLLSGTGGRAASAIDRVGDHALGATGKLVAYGGVLAGIGVTALVVSGKLTILSGVIAGIGIAAAPVVAALGGLAIAFGAIIGSGIFAGMDRLKSSFREAMSEIKPMIAAFGEQFVPLLNDAIKALPGLVASILDALPPMDRFTGALRTLGARAAEFLPQLVDFLTEIAWIAVPAFVDTATFIMDNLVPAFNDLVNMGFKLYNGIRVVADILGEVWTQAKLLWNAFRNGVSDGESLYQKLIDVRDAFLSLWKQTKPTRQSLVELGQELVRITGLLTGMALDVIELALNLREELQPAATFIVDTLVGVAKWVGRALTAIRTLGTNVSTEAGKMDKAWNKVRKLGAVTMQTFKDIRRIITQALQYVWQNIIQPILANIQQLWNEHGNQIKESVNQLLNALLGAFRFLRSSARKIWNKFGDEIMVIVDFFSEYIVTAITQFADFLMTTFDVVTDLLAGDWEGAWNAIKGFASRTWDRMRGLFNSFTDALRKLLDSLVSWAVGAWDGFKSDLVSATQDLVNGIANWFSKLPGRLQDFVNDFLNKGEQFIQGVIDGVSNKTSDLVDEAVGAAEDAANGLIDAFNRILPNNFTIPEVTVGGGTWDHPGPGTTDVPEASFGGDTVNIPELASGGFVERTGIAEIHEGERIFNPAKVDKGNVGPGGGDTYVDVNVDARGATDPKQVATHVSSEMRSVINK